MRKIHNFKEMLGLTSPLGYFIEVDLSSDVYSSASIKSKINENFYDYLTTHTFYGGSSTREAQKLLTKLGFDVQLVPEESNI